MDAAMRERDKDSDSHAKAVCAAAVSLLLVFPSHIDGHHRHTARTTSAVRTGANNVSSGLGRLVQGCDEFRQQSFPLHRVPAFLIVFAPPPPIESGLGLRHFAMRTRQGTQRRSPPLARLCFLIFPFASWLRHRAVHKKKNTQKHVEAARYHFADAVLRRVSHTDTHTHAWT